MALYIRGLRFQHEQRLVLIAARNISWSSDIKTYPSSFPIFIYSHSNLVSARWMDSLVVYGAEMVAKASYMKDHISKKACCC